MWMILHNNIQFTQLKRMEDLPQPSGAPRPPRNAPQVDQALQEALRRSLQDTGSRTARSGGGAGGAGGGYGGSGSSGGSGGGGGGGGRSARDLELEDEAEIRRIQELSIQEFQREQVARAQPRTLQEARGLAARARGQAESRETGVTSDSLRLAASALAPLVAAPLQVPVVAPIVAPLVAPVVAPVVAAFDPQYLENIKRKSLAARRAKEIAEQEEMARQARLAKLAAFKAQPPPPQLPAEIPPLPSVQAPPPIQQLQEVLSPLAAASQRALETSRGLLGLGLGTPQCTCSPNPEDECCLLHQFKGGNMQSFFTFYSPK
jgi:hypothetical protein